MSDHYPVVAWVQQVSERDYNASETELDAFVACGQQEITKAQNQNTAKYLKQMTNTSTATYAVASAVRSFWNTKEPLKTTAVL